jgi:hypothetical protein
LTLGSIAYSANGATMLASKIYLLAILFVLGLYVMYDAYDNVSEDADDVLEDADDVVAGQDDVRWRCPLQLLRLQLPFDDRNKSRRNFPVLPTQKSLGKSLNLLQKSLTVCVQPVVLVARHNSWPSSE